MRNLACALIEHGIIHTTEAKAKQLRRFVEGLITIAKDGLAANDNAGVTLAKRRLAFAYLNNKEAVKALFAEVAPRSMNRPGGYTRVIKTGPRQGDGAPMAYIELVDRPAAASRAGAAKPEAAASAGASA